jgi:hypothetical protein
MKYRFRDTCSKLFVVRNFCDGDGACKTFLAVPMWASALAHTFSIGGIAASTKEFSDLALPFFALP